MNINELIENALNELINEEKKIFCSEADFQFALAWKIKELSPKIDIKLEFTPWKFDPNIHIDIVVSTEGQMIPIELKYKTKKLEKNNIENQENLSNQNAYDVPLKTQGAHDVGRYDFVHDIHRMEQIIDSKKYPIQTAYAIFLTNDSLYWKKPKKDTIDKQFRIHEYIEQGGKKWEEGTSEEIIKNRRNLNLRGAYPIKWIANTPEISDDYPLFKYAIVKITKQNDETLREQLISTSISDDQASLSFVKAKFELPSVTLLDPPYEQTQVGTKELQETSLRIENILNTFNLKSKVLSVLPGPVISQFIVQPGEGTSSKNYHKVAKDLARCLEKQDVRVVENLTDANCIGLEIPNSLKQTIFLKEIINSNKFRRSSSKLTLALGKNIAGYSEVTDLAKAPHLLVAGTTGSGKSVGINAMILSMLYRCTPEELRLLLVDPSELEFTPYDGIPHLLTPVITDMTKAVHALKWCVKEMERRYALMKRFGVRKIDLLNEKIEEKRARGGFVPNPFSLMPENPESLTRLPYIVIIINELADLVLSNSEQIEPEITRLTQKARPAGIHLIMATQRPSTDIVTPIIKTNCPTRISFQVSNRYDSQTILGDSGAENLLGHGDMLFMSPGRPFRRIHGAIM